MEKEEMLFLLKYEKEINKIISLQKEIGKLLDKKENDDTLTELECVYVDIDCYLDNDFESFCYKSDFTSYIRYLKKLIKEERKLINEN